MKQESIDRRELVRSGDRLQVHRIVSLSAGPAVSLGLGRFGYTFRHPSMRSQLHWSYTTAGVMGGPNALGYLVGSLLSGPTARRVGIRRMFLGSMVLTSVAVLSTGFSTTTSAIRNTRRSEVQLLPPPRGVNSRLFGCRAEPNRSVRGGAHRADRQRAGPGRCTTRHSVPTCIRKLGVVVPRYC